MSAIVSIQYPLSPPRQIRLREGTVTRFGSTDWADVCVSEDQDLAEVHFLLRVSQGGCELKDLSSGLGTFLNDQIIEVCTRLTDQDVIRAGNTEFKITITNFHELSDEYQNQQTEPASNPKENNEESLSELSVYLQLNEKAVELAAHGLSQMEFVQKVYTAGLLSDALKACSYLLPKNVAVNWASCCVRESVKDLTQVEIEALAAAERWAEERTDEARRSCEELAGHLKEEGPAAFVALAAFWSEGSLAPDGYDLISPDQRLSCKAIAAALTMAAYRVDTSNAKSLIRDYLNRASELFYDGKRADRH